MIAIIVLFLMSTPIQSQNWCPNVKPNGIYRGLHIYTQFSKDGKNKYVMTNGAGHQWLFNIFSMPRLDLEIVNGSVSKSSESEQNIIYTFKTWTNCSVYRRTDPNGKPFVTYCHDYDGTIIVDNSTEYYTEIVVLKNSPKDSTRVLFFNRLEKDSYFAYLAYKSSPKFDCKVKDAICEVPKFIKQMSASIFRQIIGVVDFDNIGDKSGHLLLFNISGQPKYCFNEFMADISQECNSSSNMKTLFNECFQIPESTPENNPKSLTDNLWFRIIVAVVVFAVMLGIIIWVVIVVWRKRSITTLSEARD